MKVLITGSTKGIGKAITDVFAPFATEIILTSRTLIDLEDQKIELQKKYPELKIHILAADFSLLDEVNYFCDFVSNLEFTIDILVNNAGIFLPGNILEESLEDHQTMMMVNFSSVYTLCRRLIPSMKSAGTGHIFNICSVASLKAYSNGGSYSISKFALYGLTQNLREELKTFGVKVTAVLPGATWSNSWAGADLPDERLMDAMDIAKCILNAAQLSPAACVEEIIIRPQLGDL